MLQAATLKFLDKLAKNNNKPWFEANKEAYENAKADFVQLVDALLQKMGSLDPAFTEQKAKDCVYRIYRDVRFSNDKTPYKSHFGAFFTKGGKKYNGAGYYLHVEPGKNMVGGGLWQPEGPVLKKVRQEIDYNFDEFEGITGNKSFKKYFKEINGERLKTLPQGYAADNPAIDYLKLKSFTVGHRFEDQQLTGKDFVKECMSVFTGMSGLVDFINRAID